MMKHQLLYFSLSLFLIVTSCGEKRESTTATKTDIVESVYSSASIEPASLYSFYSKVPGQIINFMVKVGDTIQAGDIICRIDAMSAIKGSENARLNMDLIQNQMSGETSLLLDIENEIETARFACEVDSADLHRVKKLRETGNASVVELEQVELKYKLSKSKLENLLNRKKRLERELKIQKQQARNNYVSSLSTSDGSTIQSYVNGVVYDIFKEQGEIVNIQEPIGRIGSAKEFEIQLLIDEKDIVDVSEGQKIIMTLQAYPDKTFEAKVERIYPTMSGRTQSFMVLASFVNAPPKLYLGLTGEANIIVEERQDVLVIPRNYIIDGSFVETDEGKVEIETGIKSLTHVEVVKGLKEGATLYMPEL